MKTIHYTISFIFCFLIPLFFLPTVTDSSEWQKLILFICLDLFLLIYGAWIVLTQKKISVPSNPYYIPIGILCSMMALSTIIQSSNPWMSLITPLSTSTWIALLATMILVPFVFKHISPKHLVIPWVMGSTIVSAYILLGEIGLYPSLIRTPVGNLLTTGIYLAMSALIAISYVISARTSDTTSKSVHILLSVGSILVLVAGVSTLHHLLTDHRPIILPPDVGVSLIPRSFHTWKSVLLGSGVGDFLPIYTAYKTPNINASPYWNINFTSSSSYILTMIVESGLGTLVPLLWIFFRSLYGTLFHRSLPDLWIVSALLLLCMLPGNMILFLILGMGCILSSRTPHHKTRQVSTMISIVGAGISIMLVGYVIWIYAPLVRAEIRYTQALHALQEKKTKEAYDKLGLAIQEAPHSDMYAMAFSKTNILLAKLIAEKDTPTTEEKAIQPILIKQAIEYANLAVENNKKSVITWTNRGSIYAELLDFADHADSWSTSSYQEAIHLDPLNPILAATLGGVYLKTHQIDLALSQATHAIDLKSDIASGYVLQGNALKEKGDTTSAREAFSRALQHTRQGSAEYDMIMKQLEVSK